MKLIFNNIKAIKGSGAIYDIEITFNNSDNNDYYYKLIRLHPFVFGNNNDMDMILYPESVKIQFSLVASEVPIPGEFPNPFSSSPSRKDYESEYYRLINIISFDESLVIIKKNGSEYFRGFIDVNYKSTSYYTDIEILILSNFTKLKDISPKTELLGLNPNTDNKILYTEVAKKILQLAFPGLQNVIFESEIKATTNFTFLSEPWNAPAENLGNYIFNFVGSISPHDTMIDLIKEILQTFGCLGIVLGNSFIMQPRGYYEGAQLVTLKAEHYKMGNEPSVYYSQKIEGLVVKVRAGDVPDIFHEVHYGNVILDDEGEIKNRDELEFIIISTPGGDPPGIDGDEFPLMIRNLWAWVPEHIAGIGNAQWVATKRNEFFTTNISTKAALWKIIGDGIWAVIKNSRLVFITTLIGTNYNYNRFYKLENSGNLILKIRKIAFDDFENESECDLISSVGDYDSTEGEYLILPYEGEYLSE